MKKSCQWGMKKQPKYKGSLISRSLRANVDRCKCCFCLNFRKCYFDPERKVEERNSGGKTKFGLLIEE